MTTQDDRVIWQPQYGPEDARWQTRRVVHDGYRTFEVGALTYKRFDGCEITSEPLELMTCGPVVGVLPYDPKRDEVVMIEQIRVGCVGSRMPWALEVVAGMVHDGESLTAAAHRELEEETHLRTDTLQCIAHYWPSPGLSNELVHVYLAHVDATQVQPFGGLDDESEDIRCHRFALKDVMRMVRDGVIDNAVSVIALQRFMLMQSEEKGN